MNNKFTKKKIVYLITGTDVGGAETVVRNLMFNLDLNIFSPVLISIRPLGIIGKEISKRFKVISLDVKQKFNFLFLLKLFLYLKKESPDILHCHLFHANFLGRIIGRMVGVPFIISTIHTDNFGGRMKYFLLKITDFLNNITVVVSKRIKDDLVEKKILSFKKIKIIYNGIENYENNFKISEIEKIKNNLGITNCSPILLSVGRLNKLKGHIYLIRSIKILKDKYPNIKLLIIGKGEEEYNLKNEVSKLELDDYVLFLGELRKISLYYKLSDLFILPSVNEGFGLSILEAMNNKLLVIASNVGGIPEIIKDGVTGFTVLAGDCVSLSNKIDEVFSMENQKKFFIINEAYKNLLNNFTVDIMVSEYTNLYLKIN